MKKFNIIIVMIFCFNINFSQQSTEAKQLLNKVSENIKSYKNVFINYVYSLNNEELDIDEENSGSFVKEKEKWKLEFVGITRIFDGEKLYTIIPDDEEVTISSENPEEESTITPNQLLYFYEDGYTMELDRVEYLKNKSRTRSKYRKKIQYVKLVPKDSDSPYKYVHLGIDTEFNQIYRVFYTGKDDLVTTITIVDFEFNVKLDDNIFIFNENDYEDYYLNIID